MGVDPVAAVVPAVLGSVFQEPELHFLEPSKSWKAAHLDAASSTLLRAVHVELAVVAHRVLEKIYGPQVSVAALLRQQRGQLVCRHCSKMLVRAFSEGFEARVFGVLFQAVRLRRHQR